MQETNTYKDTFCQVVRNAERRKMEWNGMESVCAVRGVCAVKCVCGEGVCVQ